MSKDYPWGNGTVKWERDATANDSDKSFTTPAGKIREFSRVYVEITATATVGNRNLGVSISNGTDVIWHSQKTANITASQTGNMFLGVGFPLSGNTASFQPLTTGASPNITSYNGLSPMILPAGYVLRVYEANAVDAAADDMTVVLHYVEYDA